jgi:hypothetical protein
LSTDQEHIIMAEQQQLAPLPPPPQPPQQQSALSYRERLAQFKILEEKRFELIEVPGP